jgi:hypothetical protein
VTVILEEPLLLTQPLQVRPLKAVLRLPPLLLQLRGLLLHA